MHILLSPQEFKTSFQYCLELSLGKTPAVAASTTGKPGKCMLKTLIGAQSQFWTVTDQRKALKFRSNQIKIPISQKSRGIARFVSTWPFVVGVVATREFLGAVALIACPFFGLRCDSFLLAIILMKNSKFIIVVGLDIASSDGGRCCLSERCNFFADVQSTLRLSSCLDIRVFMVISTTSVIRQARTAA